jgi:uncharacterized repeat protein (TIGR01451 family)
MTGLLSSISGQFTKALILGALFPAAIFVILWLMVVAPLFPPDFALPAPRILDKDWGALSTTFATLVVAGLLYNLDTPLIKLYEGYPWQDTFLGRWRTGVRQAELRKAQARAKVLFEVVRDREVPGRGGLVTEWGRVLQTLVADFPERETLVLPTRLGNVLRAFERYPSVQYNMEVIHFWPRLVDVIPGGYAAALDDARTSLVFLLNLSFLASLLAVATAAAGALYLPPDPLLRVVLPALAFAFASFWLYTLSLGPAYAWGEMVKGAVDLYRWDLLEKLGYEQKPRTRDGERELWGKLTQQGVYGDRWVDLVERRPRIDYADPPAARPRTSVRAGPDGVGLEVSRGVKGQATNGEVRVVVQVSNVDEARRPANGVVVTDTLAEGLEYVWGSARAGGREVRTVGINPYHFHLGDVEHGAGVVLSYSVSPSTPAKGG